MEWHLAEKDYFISPSRSCKFRLMPCKHLYCHSWWWWWWWWWRWWWRWWWWWWCTGQQKWFCQSLWPKQYMAECCSCPFPKICILELRVTRTVDGCEILPQFVPFVPWFLGFLSMFQPSQIGAGVRNHPHQFFDHQFAARHPPHCSVASVRKWPTAQRMGLDGARIRDDPREVKRWYMMIVEYLLWCIYIYIHLYHEQDWIGLDGNSMQRFYHLLRSIQLYEANEDDPSRRSVICVCVCMYVCTPSCLSLGYTWIFPKFSSCITGIVLGISGMVTDPDHSFPFAAGVQGGWPWPPGKLAVSTGGCNCRGGRTHAQGQEIQETAGRCSW